MTSRSGKRSQLLDVGLTILLPCAAGVILCALAATHWRYLHLRLLQWSVSVLCGWMMVVAFRLRRTWLKIGFLVTILVFNPILPIQAKPDVWEVLETLGATWFAVAGVCAAAMGWRRRGG